MTKSFTALFFHTVKKANKNLMYKNNIIFYWIVIKLNYPNFEACQPLVLFFLCIYIL
jgi:hypothetical protein